MTCRPTVERRTLLLLGLAFIVIVASALAWHFYQTGREPALLVPSVEIERTNRETVPLYGLLEADLRVDAKFENPFDPEEVNVTAVFTSPSGRVLDIPAFYYQDFNRTLAGNEERFSPLGDPYWKVRFAPTETGEHAFYARLEDEGQVVTSNARSFSVPGTR